VRNLSKEPHPRNSEETEKKVIECERSTASIGAGKSKPIQDRRGAALLATVILLLPLGCLAALFLDVGRLYAIRARMQVAADAAALAAASGLIDGDDEGDSVQARAQYYVAMNPIEYTPAFLELLQLNADLGTIRVILRYQTGPLLWAPGGLTLRMVAGARAQKVQPGETGRPIPHGNAFGWWKHDKINAGAQDSGVVKLTL
jgi:hypothetical protein